MNLSTHVKVTQVLGYYAAGTTTRKADIIDMADYDGVMFVYELGTILDTGTIDCFVGGDLANTTGTMTKLVGTSVVTVNATTAAYAKSCVLVDLYQIDASLHRYLEAGITPAVANAVILGITAIQYKGNRLPAVQAATTLKTTFLQAPTE